MPNLPIPTISYVTTQDNDTGNVTFLEYKGDQLVGSDTHNYGIGTSFKVVANEDILERGYPDLITQNAAGQVDFLILDQNGNLQSTLLDPTPVPRIFGSGYFGEDIDNSFYPSLMSQLPNGSLDALFFDSQGNLDVSDLVPNTAGTPHAAAVAGGFPYAAFNDGTENDTVITQTANGSIDLLDFSGFMSSHSLNVASSYLIPNTAGLDPVQAADQDAQHLNINGGGNNSLQGIQFVTQATGSENTLYVDSGYSDTANEGTLYGAVQNALPGNVTIVDGGETAASIYRATPAVDVPAPTQTDVTVQNAATGVVDFLKYQGASLVASASHDYGTGSDFKIVASDFNSSTDSSELVEQNSAGQIDFLSINASGNLTASDLTTQAFAPIIGSGYFSGTVTGQAHSTLVSQLSDGSLDTLAFNSLGQLIGSDLVQGSAGLPHAVGVGESYAQFSLYAGGDANGNPNDTIVTQLADGTVDMISLAGAISNATLGVSGSYTLASTAGVAPIGAINQNYGSHESVPGQNSKEGIQFVTQTADGHLNTLYVDSGYGDAANEGTLYASNKSNETFSGYHVVDGGVVARQIFPIS